MEARVFLDGLKDTLQASVPPLQPAQSTIKSEETKYHLKHQLNQTKKK
jgi:hypothetical protein